MIITFRRKSSPHFVTRTLGRPISGSISNLGTINQNVGTMCATQGSIGQTSPASLPKKAVSSVVLSVVRDPMAFGRKTVLEMDSLERTISSLAFNVICPRIFKVPCAEFDCWVIALKEPTSACDRILPKQLRGAYGVASFSSESEAAYYDCQQSAFDIILACLYLLGYISSLHHLCKSNVQY